MARDQLEHQVRTRAGGSHQAAARIGPEQPLQRIGVRLDAGNDLTAVEPGSTLADVHGLHDHDLAPGFRQV